MDAREVVGHIRVFQGVMFVQLLPNVFGRKEVDYLGMVQVFDQHPKLVVFPLQVADVLHLFIDFHLVLPEDQVSFVVVREVVEIEVLLEELFEFDVLDVQEEKVRLDLLLIVLLQALQLNVLLFDML